MPYSEAIAEAYASAPLEEVVLDTIELRHPAFVDENGAPTAVRVVAAFEDKMLALENDAPLNPGQSVKFVACPFQFGLPGFDDNSVPQIDIKITGVSREITAHLEQAIATLTPIQLTYRPYLESDPSGPQLDPPYNLILTKVTVDDNDVSGVATLEDVNNWAFPNRKYTPIDFPGLAR